MFTDSGSSGATAASPRNRVRGVVTRVTRGKVMASVEIHAGPHRVVSLMGLDDAAGIEPGMLAVASMKSTDVVIGIPSRP